MRLPRPNPLVVLGLSAIQLAEAGTWPCEAVVDNIHFRFQELKGVHSVWVLKDTPPTTLNTTFQINPCGPIRKSKDEPKNDQCQAHTQVCGIERAIFEDNSTHVLETIPIAADFNHNMEQTYTRLKTSESTQDKGREGLRVKLTGGTYQGQAQQAIIEFVCDMDRTGLEGNEAEDEGGSDDDEDVGKRDEEGGDDGAKGKSLKFVSYDAVEKGQPRTLMLEWRTRLACEKVARGEDGSDEKSGGWGFFTWLIIIVFLGVAAYLIFGSYLNYSRYGYRGWDLLPHSDTIRDLPYLLRDWGRRVVGTLSGTRRGGYSAV